MTTYSYRQSHNYPRLTNSYSYFPWPHPVTNGFNYPYGWSANFPVQTRPSYVVSQYQDRSYARENGYPMASGEELYDVIYKLENNIPIRYDMIKAFPKDNAEFRIFSVLEDNGTIQKFLLKQQSDKASTWIHFTLVLEAVAARIAEEMNLPINRVRIIPPGVPSELVPFPELPATLHSFIEGIPPKGLNIMQNSLKDTPVQFRGLILQVIEDMSKHEDLAKITAFDTFLGNTDRHWNNVFYIPSTDNYIGIDQGDIFRSLVGYAINNIKELREERIKLSPQVIIGLEIYRDTLIQLQANYPLEKIFAYVEEATAYSGLKRLDFYNQNEVNMLEGYERENIIQLPRLIEEINMLLELQPSLPPALPGEPIKPQPQLYPRYLIKPGTKNSEHVKWIQTALNQLYGPIVDVTGNFDPATEEAIRRFQAEQGLTADAIVGSMTWNKLLLLTYGRR